MRFSEKIGAKAGKLLAKKNATKLGVAAEIGVTPVTLRRWIREGKIVGMAAQKPCTGTKGKGKGKGKGKSKGGRAATSAMAA